MADLAIVGECLLLRRRTDLAADRHPSVEQGAAISTSIDAFYQLSSASRAARKRRSGSSSTLFKAC